ncbi:MAG: SCP2 sterol-binding domain-containing protein [Pseudomonadota bacterium]
MSDMINAAVAALNEKMGGDGFDGSVKIDIEGEGAIMINEDGASAGDGDADCTLSASAEVFQSILAGETNATAAFMGGNLSVDGDMGTAMKLGTILS